MDENPKKPAKPATEKSGQENNGYENTQERLEFIRKVVEKREAEHRSGVHKKK